MVQGGASLFPAHSPGPLTSSQSGLLRPPGPKVGSVHSAPLPVWLFLQTLCWACLVSGTGAMDNTLTVLRAANSQPRALRGAA